MSPSTHTHACGQTPRGASIKSAREIAEAANLARLPAADEGEQEGQEEEISTDRSKDQPSVQRASPGMSGRAGA